MNEPESFATNEDNPTYPNEHLNIKALKCPLNGNNVGLDVPRFQTVNAYQWGNQVGKC